MENTETVSAATQLENPAPVGPTVTLTPEAVVQIQRMLEESGQQGYGLRYGIQGGGCSGYSYLMEFEENPQEDDEVLEYGGVRVFVNPLHQQYVQGSVIGWEDNLMQSGFHIDNPNVTRKCGCGTSVDF